VRPTGGYPSASVSEEIVSTAMEGARGRGRAGATDVHEFDVIDPALAQTAERPRIDHIGEASPGLPLRRPVKRREDCKDAGAAEFVRVVAQKGVPTGDGVAERHEAAEPFPAEGLFESGVPPNARLALHSEMESYGIAVTSRALPYRL